MYITQLVLYLPLNMGLIFWTLHKNLEPKKDSFILKYGFEIMFISVLSLVYFKNYSEEFYTTPVKLIFNATMLAHYMINYKGKLSKKLYIYTIVFVVAGITEAVVHITTIILGLGVIYPYKTSADVIIVLSYYNLLLFITLSLFTKFNQRKNDKSEDSGFKMYVLVPFSQLFLAESIFVDYSDEKFSLQKMILFFIGTLIAVITDIILFRSIKIIQESERAKEKMKAMKYRHELESSYYENVQKSIAQTMKYKHDFNNILTMAHSLVRSSDKRLTDEGNKLLDELKEKNEKLTIPFYTSNATINAVLYDKKCTSEELGIDLCIDVNISENINNIELMDLCSVFSNLIDNAFNAAGKSKNKKVELYAWLNVGYMFVKTCNYPDETPDINEKKNKRGLTDKHGYGIEILNDLCEKYDGEFIFSSENDRVSAVCSLRY